MLLSKRVQLLSPSLTIAISTKAKELKAQGKDVLSFSAGEPDFDTPEILKDAVKTALDKGCGKYTPVPGTKEVLEAISTKLKKDNNLDYKTSQIITNVGAKHSLFNAMQAIIDDGDEVILASPYWVTYPELIKYCGGKPVVIKTSQEDGFKITADKLKKAITPKTKALILNSPSNPCGSVYDKKDFEEIAKILENTDIIVLSDEIYEKLTFGREFVSFASISNDAFKRTITINGLSKCGAITGWRFGYTACVIDDINDAIKKLQSQSTSNISSIVQAGAIPSLLGQSDKDIKFMHDEYIKRRDYAVEAINKIEGLKVLKPDGAFYLFVNCENVEKNSIKFCEKLLDEALVAVVPGIGFGQDGYFRFSYATDLQTIKKGIERIKQFVQNYK